MRAILRKDLLLLRRSPLLLGLLLAYPLLVALLISVVVGYANTKPRVALVDRDGLPATVELAGEKFDVRELIERVSSEVDLVEMAPDEAERQLETGRVVAAVVVPRGFVSDLRASRSPELVLERGTGGLTPIVTREMEALVFNLNRELQDAIVATNLGYVEPLRERLDRTSELLGELPAGPGVEEIRGFVTVAGLALAQTETALRATASPIRLRLAPERGRTWALSAQVQAYGLALAITFLGLVLAAGALAAERDENVIGRLARGLVTLGRLVWAKAALAAVVALALGLALAVVFGVAVEVGDVAGGEPWARLPLLAAGLALAGGSVGALGALVGALAREGRTASLVAVLVVLPILLVGLVPPEVSPAAGYVSDAFPFAHAVDFFLASLYETEPWRHVAEQAAWLAALGLAYGGAARVAARRLLA
ncbi:MAG: ABC transporter permease [Gaiellaceae bacterium]